MEESMKNYRRKQYRPNRIDGNKFVTVSLTIDEELIDAVEKIVDADTEGTNNVSHYIEENVSAQLPFRESLPMRRGYKSSPLARKTFTFSPEFVLKLNKYGNRSLLIELLMSRHL